MSSVPESLLPTVALLPGWLDPETLLRHLGPYMLVGLCLIVFAECGLLVGFFLPGDSLLFTAGVFAALPESNPASLPFPLVLVGVPLAAIVGAQVGYLIGRRAGPALFRRPDSRFFHQRNVDRARAYFEDHGPKTVELARFIPVVRTFTPVVAGVGRMNYRTFVTFNVLGGLLWAVGVTLLGYVLGETIPDIDRYLIPAVLVIVALSFIPVGRELLKARRRRTAATAEATDDQPSGT